MSPEIVSEMLSAAPERRVRDRLLALVGSSAGALVAAAWALGAIDQLDELTEAVPVLACTICPLASAALLAIAANGALRVLSRCGGSLEASQELVFDALRAAAGPAQARATVPARIARAEGPYAALALSCAPPGPVL